MVNDSSRCIAGLQFSPLLTSNLRASVTEVGAADTVIGEHDDVLPANLLGAPAKFGHPILDSAYG